MTISIFCSQVTCFSNYYAGDPYVGGSEKEIEMKNKEIAELGRETRRLKDELSRMQEMTYGRGVGSSRYAKLALIISSMMLLVLGAEV